MIEHEEVRHHDQSTTRTTRQPRNNAFDFRVAPGPRCNGLHIYRSGGSFEISVVVASATWRRVGIEEHADALHVGDDLSQQIEHLGSDRGFRCQEAGYVSTRPGKGRYESIADGVGDN